MMKKHSGLMKDPSRYLFLVPGAIIYLLIIVIPAFYSLYLSMFKWNGIAAKKIFVGFKNYSNIIIHDPVFKTALKNNVTWTVLTLIITVSVGLLFALLVNKKFSGRTMVRGVLYFPYVLSGITVAMTWNWVYHPQMGMLVNLMQGIGLPQFAKAWLADSKTAFYAVFAAGFWHGVGMPMVLFMSGLQTIPPELEEAANIDGANKFQNFINITIPMLKETFIIVFATQIIQSLKIYDIITGMTAGGPEQSTQTLATWMVTQTYNFSNIGTGTALAWILVFVSILVVIPYVMFMIKE